MRDLILAAIVFGSVPFILRNPFFGLLMWAWLGIMNPHRFTWGFAYSLPFAQIVAIATFAAIVFNRDKLYRFPSNAVTVLLVVFVLWLGVSPLFSLNPDNEFFYWSRAFKIQLMVLIALILTGNREQLHQLTWVLAMSVGFFGIKGGLFTIASGGQHRVWGPASSFIEDNNTLALAIIMVVPLFRFLQLHASKKWISNGCMLAIGLCTISAIGSQSRGALLALAAMGAFLWTKSSHKGMVSMLIFFTAILVALMMPESWYERMATIGSYDQDASAMGRINSWWMAWNLAVDRFPIGGGFAIYTRHVFALYAPDPNIVLAAHSIYFQILGEHGFIGLALFLGVFWTAWRTGSWVIKTAKGRDDLNWARDLAAMCQVSLVGYAVGGAFLSLTYFDLPYYIVVVLVALRVAVNRQLLEQPLTAEQNAAPAPALPRRRPQPGHRSNPDRQRA